MLQTAMNRPWNAPAARAPCQRYTAFIPALRLPAPGDVLLLCHPPRPRHPFIAVPAKYTTLNPVETTAARDGMHTTDSHAVAWQATESIAAWKLLQPAD